MFEWNGRKNALNLFSDTAQVFDTKYIKAKIHGQFKLLDFLQYFKNVTFRLCWSYPLLKVYTFIKVYIYLFNEFYSSFTFIVATFHWELYPAFTKI